MLRNYITTAFRQLLKHRNYTVLNVVGLSVGFACFTLIGHWVNDELSYDKFHDKAERLYRVGAYFTDESGKFDQAVTCIPLAPALKNDLPEVEDAARIDQNGAVVKYGDKEFVEEDILAVDNSFFNLFDYKLKKGNLATALKDPYCIILSESMAKKYFGDKDPLGESLKIFQYDPDGKGADYKITGIIEDCPTNSHFHYNFLFSFSTIERYEPSAFGYDGWFNNSYFTYVLLKEGVNLELLQKKLSPFLEKYIGSDMKKYKIYWSYFLQPITDIHLKSHLRYEIKPTNNISYVMIFGAVGFVVLLLACINYVNLSTAYATDRFKEVGVRKVMGAFKNQLIAQYLAESWLLAMISLLVAFVWIELSRPLFENLTGKEIANLYSVDTLIVLVLIASVVGLLAGIYPSFLLSSFKTVNVLKGQFRTGSSGAWLRKGLVVIQNSITVILIAGIILIQLQLQFINSRDLGFNKENLLVMNANGSDEVRTQFSVFANELSANTSVVGIARSNSFLANGLGNRTAAIEHASGKKVNGTIYTLAADQEYLETYQMKLIAGRNFIKGSKADSLKFIVNEVTARNYGYKDPEDIVGKEMYFGNTKCEIIGVIKDFHFNSLQHKIEPTCIGLLFRGRFSRISIRLKDHRPETVALIANLWKKHFPNSVLDYSFAEDRLQKQYVAEQRFSKIFSAFSVISLGIACLGLFSLVSYSVEVRVKEIGIRKVLGATVRNIWSMISKEFLQLIFISWLIAVPLAWYFMRQWLEGFAYRVNLNPLVLVVACMLVLMIALLTVSSRSIKAAMGNPVESLRSE